MNTCHFAICCTGHHNLPCHYHSSVTWASTWKMAWATLNSLRFSVTQALEKAEAEVKLLSEEDRILRATIVERKPQVVRVTADISQAQEQKVQFLKISGCYKMRRKTCIYLFMHSSPNSPWMSESWYLSLHPYSKNCKKKRNNPRQISTIRSSNESISRPLQVLLNVSQVMRNCFEP
jgi:hypothetical protein